MAKTPNMNDREKLEHWSRFYTAAIQGLCSNGTLSEASLVNIGANASHLANIGMTHLMERQNRYKNWKEQINGEEV